MRHAVHHPTNQPGDMLLKPREVGDIDGCLEDFLLPADEEGNRSAMLIRSTLRSVAKNIPNNRHFFDLSDKFIHIVDCRLPIIPDGFSV